MGKRPKKLDLGFRLTALIKACEKACVAGCCGIDAFNFSPLHIASHLSALSIEISKGDIKAIEGEINLAISKVSELSPTEDGIICLIEDLNQYFSETEFIELMEKIRDNLKLAPEVLRYSKELEKEQARL